MDVLFKGIKNSSRKYLLKIDTIQKQDQTLTPYRSSDEKPGNQVVVNGKVFQLKI